MDGGGRASTSLSFHDRRRPEDRGRVRGTKRAETELGPDRIGIIMGFMAPSLKRGKGLCWSGGSQIVHLSLSHEE